MDALFNTPAIEIDAVTFQSIEFWINIRSYFRENRLNYVVFLNIRNYYKVLPLSLQRHRQL